MTSWITADARRHGALVVGPPGVGVTSVCNAVADEVRKRGRRVSVIDDCHLLSDGDFDTRVSGISGDELIVLGAHPGSPWPRAVGDQWAMGQIQRFDVPRLTTSGIISLAEQVTGASMTRTAAAAVLTFSGGLALYARELLYGAPMRDQPERSQEKIRRLAYLEAGDRLIDLAVQRLSKLSESARQACEILAVAGPLPVEIALGAIDPEALDEIERLELIESADRGSIRLSPPALEAGIVAGLTIIRRTRLRRILLAATEGHTSPPELLIRIGQWALDQRDDTPTDVLVRAAEAAVARGLNEAGVALGMAVLELPADQLDPETEARARLAVGRCQWYVGSTHSAIEILRPLLENETLASVDLGSDEARARAGQIMAELLRFGRGNVRASELILRHLEAAESRRTRELVRVLRPLYTAYSGDLAAALAEFDAQAIDGSINTAHRVWSAGVYTICMTEAGRSEEAVRFGLRSLQATNLDPRERPFSTASIVSCLVYSQMVAGGPAQVRQTTGPEHSGPVTDAYRQDDGLNQLGVGMLLLAAGDMRGALEEMLGAHASMRLLDPSGFLRLGLTMAIEPAVLLGRGELAEQLNAQAEVLPQRMSTIIEVEQHRSLLWLHYLRGGSQAVRAYGDPVVERYLADGLFGGATRIQHSMLRLSVPCSIERAELLRASVAGDHPQTLIDQLVGVAREDARLLMSAAHRLEAQGCMLLAAECLAMAEQAPTTDELRKISGRKIVELLRYTGEVMSPSLVGRTSSAPLTPRELEIATQVASGLSNAEVAKRLDIKVRTVETHLQRVYEKLGVNRRTDLGMALTDA